MKVHNLIATGSLTVGNGEAIDSISSSVATTTLGLGSRITTIEGKSLVSGSSQVDVMSTTNIARLATTGSNTFQGLQTVNGSLVVTGSLTAQQFIVSSSVTYLTTSFASGSTKFGDSADDNHNFTGSFYVNGSISSTSTVTNRGEIIDGANNGNVAKLNFTRTDNSWGINNETNLRVYVGSGNTTSPATKTLEITTAGQTQFPINTNGGNIRLSSNGTAIEMYNTSGTVRNWQISSQVVNSMCMDFTPSTANGGTTYSTPVLTIDGEQNRVGIGTGTSRPTANGLTIYQGGGDQRTLLELNRPNTPGLQTAIQFTVGGSIMVGQIQHEYAASNQNHMSFSLRNSGGSNFVSMWLQNDGNVGVGTTSPSQKLDVNGSVRVPSTGAFRGSGVFHGNVNSNIGGNLGYVLLCRLDIDGGWIARGTIVCASWTCWNVTDVYLRKAYASTAVTATVTGVSKGGGQDMSVVDCNYGGYRYLALKFSGGNGEIDINLTGFGVDSYMTYLSSVTSENSTLASY